MNIDIWLDSEGAIGWGTSPDFPYQEGSFFGNLFPNPWQGYYCNGKGYDAGAVPGRLGAPLASNVYVNPYGGNVECGASGQCSAHGVDGYNSCNTSINGVFKTWTKVVTVWRNFDANTAYKICNYGTQQVPGRRRRQHGRQRRHRGADLLGRQPPEVLGPADRGRQVQGRQRQQRQGDRRERLGDGAEDLRGHGVAAGGVQLAGRHGPVRPLHA